MYSDDSSRWSTVRVAALSALLMAGAAAAGTGSTPHVQPYAIPGPLAEIDPAATPAAKAQFKCETRPFDLSAGLFCYGPAAIRAAYGVDKLIAAGADGAGQTIVIIDAFGSPFAQSDLLAFDKVYGLPDPSFKQIYMPGTPAYDGTNADVVGWTGEIALDTQWSHVVAPKAKIVLVAAKSDNDVDLIAAVNYALDNHLGNVISMSFGESESYLAYPAGLDIVKSWSSAFDKARKQHVTLFASSADNGVDTGAIGTPNVSWPAASPLVTGVGGTNLFFGIGTAASPNGAYLSEQVWNDGYGASGGGMSILIPEPKFQSANLPKSVSTLLHNYRGVPDVAYNAGVVGGVIVAWSANIPGAFYLFGGTSAGAPQWAGLTADLDQALGRPLGFLNPRLYALGGAGALAPLLHDITLGDNTNYATGVPGYPATPGYDLSTGWGTPNFGKLGAILADPNEDEDTVSAP